MAWDLYSYFLPKLEYGTDELLAGRLPVWNPYEFAGIPFLATAQPAAAYPPKLLVFGALPGRPALIAFLAAHHLLAALGHARPPPARRHRACSARSPARPARRSPPRCAAPFSCRSTIRAASRASAWTPLVFAAAESLGRGGGPRAVVGLALALAMQLTAGYPEIALDCVLLVGVLAVARASRRGRGRSPHAACCPALVAGVVLGWLAAGIQTFPLAALVLQAERAALAEHAVALFTQPGTTLALLAAALWSFPALAGVGLGAVGRREAVAPAVTLAACVALIAFAWPWLRVLPGWAAARHGPPPRLDLDGAVPPRLAGGARHGRRSSRRREVRAPACWSASPRATLVVRAAAALLLGPRHWSAPPA